MDPTVAKTLIIDDEPDLCELIQMTLDKMGLHSECAMTYQEAQEKLANEAYDLCLTDMQLPDGNGLDIIKHIQQTQPQTPVAVITAYGTMETAIEALKYGAFDFVAKPLDLQVLRYLVNSAIKLNTDPSTNVADLGQLIGQSDNMLNLKAMIQKVARSQAPIYISGESGVGKELVARMIHQLSPRLDHQFVAVNCGAIVPSLMESEFFGHRKGSFTGATHDKKGLFEFAHMGTLFLDEIAELPMDMQVKLLRAIQEKSIRQIGGSEETYVDSRIICATHKSLQDLVNANQFRQDLYYRLNVIELKVPPLRERKEDLPLLIEAIISRLCHGMNEEKPKITTDALAKLHQYHFPGNIRELENILERALTLKNGDMITSDDLQTMSSTDQQTLNIPDDNALANQEAHTIFAALQHNQWHLKKTADQLGITYRTLRYRIKKYDIQKPTDSS